MWKAYKYLYYKLYKLFVKLNGKNDSPEYLAMITIALISVFNILSIIYSLNTFWSFWYLPEFSRTQFFIYFGIPYFASLYFIFIFKGKYIQIVKEFQNETSEQRLRGKRNVIIYFVLTLLMIILSFALIVMKNEGVISGSVPR